MGTGLFSTSASWRGGAGGHLRISHRTQLQILVERLLGDPEHLAELTDGLLPPVVGLKEELLLLWGELGGAATIAAAGPGGSQAGLSALPNEVAFKLGDRPEDLEDQIAAGGGRVDRLCDAPEAHASHPEILDGGNQVGKRPSKPIQPPYDERIALSQGLKRRIQARSAPGGPRDLVFEELLAAGSP